MKLRIGNGIYGITSRDFGMTHEQSAEIFLNAGIKIIQYREKTAPTSVQIKEANRIKRLCRDYDALFVVNDRVDVAVAVNAQGLHIGQSDIDLEMAKSSFRGNIIGVSATNVSEAVMAEARGASYLGVGSIFPTATKSDADVIGLDALKEIRRNTSIPIYAIGGIKFGDLRAIMESGADGIALISSVLSAKNPIEEAEKFIKEWRNIGISPKRNSF